MDQRRLAPESAATDQIKQRKQGSDMNKKWSMAPARLGALVVALVLAGCAGSGAGGKLQGPVGAFKELAVTQPHEAVVVFLREDGTDGRVPLVLANDRVVGSLLAGRYAQARVCAGSLMAGTADRDAVVGVPAYQSLKAEAGQVVFLRVSENAQGRFELKQLDAAMAREQLGRLENASHIINRHVPDCSPKAAAPVAVSPVPQAPSVVPATVMAATPVVLKRMQLGADALFQFDRSGPADILPKGRQALDTMVDEIRRHGVSVERLRLTGHTDRLGSDAYNLQLSQQRASTVAAYIRNKGLTIPVDAVGKGEQEPVTTGCVGERVTPALVACLQPDRRVTLDLVGLVQTPAAAQAN